MTKAKTSGTDLSAIDDDKQYAVTLRRPVQVGRSWARPGQQPILKGKVIRENADAVVTFAEA